MRIASVLLATLAFPLALHGAQSPSEFDSRKVDALAISAKLTSIQTFEALAKRKQGTEQEPGILFRLIEVLHSAAAIEFRIAHGSQVKGKAANLSRYNELLTKSVGYLNRIMQAYPSHQDMPRVLYLLGKSRYEMGDKSGALAEYKRLADRFPNARETSLALISLSDLLVEFKDYSAAIEYLKRIESRPSPSDDAHAVALGRLSWIYFYTGDLRKALQYCRAEIRASRDTDQEKPLMNAARFYASGIESKSPEFSTRGAPKYLQSMVPGKSIAKAVTQLALILRSKGYDTELEELKSAAVEGDLSKGEATDLLRLVLENQLNRRRYPELVNGFNELVALTAMEDEKSRKLLVAAASQLQEELIANKGSTDSTQLGASLASLYRLVIRTSKSDPSVSTRAHFSLAETAYFLKDYAEATHHYRWVAENGEAISTGPGHAQDLKIMAEAPLRAVASRYEELRTRDLFPKLLKARAIAGAPKKSLPEDVEEWLKWVDRIEDRKSVDLFRFEGDRLLYSLGHIESAMERMLEFSRSRGSSKYSQPAAALVIDTLIASEDWRHSLELTNEFQKEKAWSESPLGPRLREISADSFYKLIEADYKDKNYSDALKLSKEFLERHPTSRHHNSARAIAANSMIALDDRRGANVQFKALSQAGGLDRNLEGTSLLTAASVAESDYDFAVAADNYRKYLELPPDRRSGGPDLEDLQRKTMTLSWLAGESIESRSCAAALASFCKATHLISALSSNHPLPGNLIQSARSEASKTSGKLRALWAAVALENAEADALEWLLLGWQELDGIERFAMLSRLNHSLPKTFARLRHHVRSNARIRLDAQAIAKRTREIAQAESLLRQFTTTIEWTGIQAAALNEIANLYQDFSNEISAIPRPKGLGKKGEATYENTLAEIRAPLNARKDEARSQAYELAASRSVDLAVFDPIAKSFGRAPASSQSKIEKLPPHSLAGAHPIQRRLNQSLDARHWQAMAYLIQEAKRTEAIEEPQLNLLQSQALLFAGARAEAVSLLENTLSDLEDHQARPVYELLISARLSTGATESAESLRQRRGK